MNHGYLTLSTEGSNMNLIPLPEPKKQDPSLSQFYAEPLRNYKAKKLERGCEPKMLTELDPKRIAEVKSSARLRGVYAAELQAFVKSESAGGQVDLENGDFAGKTPNSVYQSFRTQVEKLELKDKVQVIHQNDQVYLIRRDL